MIDLFLKATFVENLALAYFLGICTLLGGSRSVSTAFGLGIAVLIMMTVTVPLNQLIFHGLLARGAWAWAGMPDVDLSHVSLVAFIGLIAAMVQVLEMVLDRFFPSLFRALGIYLPLITVNCALLGGSLFMVERDYSLAEATVFGFGSGLGWALAVTALAAIRTRCADDDPARGRALVFAIIGIMSMGYLSFAGIQIP